MDTSVVFISWLLTIVNKAAVNIKVYISFQMSVFISSDKYLEVELLDYMIVLFLIFWGNPCFLQWLCKFIVPPTVYKCSFFATSLPTLIICCLFNNSHSDKSEVISYCGFYLHFPDGSWWALFHVSVGHLYFFLWKISLAVLCPFLISFFYIEVYHCCLVAKSCLTLLQSHGLKTRLLCPWDFPGKNTRVDCHFLRDQTLFPALTGRFFTTEPPGKPIDMCSF